MAYDTFEIPRGTSYVLWFKGGPGCDYTIACNETLTPLKSSALNDAIDEAHKILLDTTYHWRQNDGKGPVEPMACAAILGVSRILTADLAVLLADVDAKKHAAAVKAKEDQERAEFERLKKKFGAQ